MKHQKLKFLVDLGVGKKVDIVKKIMIEYSDKILDSFCVYQDGKVRIRKK